MTRSYFFYKIVFTFATLLANQPIAVIETGRELNSRKLTFPSHFSFNIFLSYMFLISVIAKNNSLKKRMHRTMDKISTKFRKLKLKKNLKKKQQKTKITAAMSDFNIYF